MAATPGVLDALDLGLAVERAEIGLAALAAHGTTFPDDVHAPPPTCSAPPTAAT